MYRKRSKTRKIIRLKNYNYSRPGYYFVTICTEGMVNYFGRIVGGKMYLNKFGKITERNWIDIPNHFSNISIDQFVVVPDHVYGIIIVVSAYMWTLQSDNDDQCNHAYMRTLYNCDRTKMAVPKIMQLYKSSVTKEINRIQNEFHFQWQKSYYDHVIRNKQSLNQIRRYIKNNPLKWEEGKNNWGWTKGSLFFRPNIC